MKQYRIADGTLSEQTAGNTQAIGVNAEHYVRGDQDAILWMSNSEDGCILYTSVKTEEGFSEPVIVYQNTELQGNYFTAQLMEDGSWEIILNASDMGNEEESSLYFIKKENRPQVELEDIILNEAEENEEGHPFSYSLTNSSQEPISEFQLTVKEGQDVLMDKTVESEKRILPGETLYFEDTLSLKNSDQSGVAELTIQAAAAGQMCIRDRSICLTPESAITGFCLNMKI